LLARKKEKPKNQLTMHVDNMLVVGSRKLEFNNWKYSLMESLIWNTLEQTIYIFEA